MTNDDLLIKAARLLAIQQQMTDLAAEKAEIDKALEALDPERVHRGHGVRIQRTPVRTVDQKAAQADYPMENYPGLYQRKVTDAFQLEAFKAQATEDGTLADYQKVSYRTKVEAEATAYAPTSPTPDDDDLGF